MKPAVDEMFPEGAGPYVDLDEAGGSTGLLMDLAANEKQSMRTSSTILKTSLMMMISSECPSCARLKNFVKLNTTKILEK
uniref:COP9 signalosome complex subunit 9 n=1 Tax=Anguilla anguilla TaxID=7936 RepID=A0A0E9TXN0_ANGAN